ncbi:MAG: DUF5916 domain-containing protein [Flavobacteriaceae bacterium]
MRRILFICLLGLMVWKGYSQTKNASYKLHIKKTVSSIKIDGIGDEQAWQTAEVADDFFMVTPMDTAKSTDLTEIRMTYDDKRIYLLAIFYKTQKQQYTVESLRRDFGFNQNDNFLLFIDPYNNQTTGFSFGANAAGAQWDGTMFQGNDIDLNWDSKWVSKVKQDSDKWVFEMAVPFKSIRYEEGVMEWGINFSRLELATSEKSSWAPIPRQFPTSTLAYTGILVWDQPPPKPKTNLSIIPYLLGSLGKDLEDNSVDEFKVGGDIKYSITSSLNLDLTINPDFSQVEVDRQVTNFDRFELFFPERRQFFLENGDIFANFGFDRIRPFFSRRIGLNVPIQGGLRLSGNIDENWRVGLMDIQTSRDEEIGLPNQNFGVLAIQRKVFSRSSIGMMFVNQQSFNYPQDTDSLRMIYPKYNRNLGLEYNLASANNQYVGKAFVFKSITDGEEGDGIAQAAALEYRSRRWNWEFQQEYVAEDYRADVGFVPRIGYVNGAASLGHTFFSKKGKIQSHGPSVFARYYFDTDLKKTDNFINLDWEILWLNRSEFAIEYDHEYVELLEPFDPTNTGNDTLAIGSRHSWSAIRASYSSKPQNRFTYGLATRLGGYYESGTRINFTGELGYRFQPFVSLRSSLSFNEIKLPEPWNVTNFWLIGAEADVTFTNNLYWSTLFQYNEQVNNFNINSRLQWRYAPASDLFLVFTQNELLDPLNGRDWAVTLKLTYWFNP